MSMVRSRLRAPPILQKRQQFSLATDTARDLAARVVQKGGTKWPSQWHVPGSIRKRVLLRRGVPAELRNAVGKREEKTSLKTRDPAEAKRLHAIAMVALEERWANLRTPARRFKNGELHDITVLAYKACLREGNVPVIDWDISLAEDLWTDTYETALSVDPELMRSGTAKHYHRRWCQQRADEHLASLGINPPDEDRLKVAKAIGLGAHKAITALHRQAQGDFRADSFLTGENVPHGSTCPSSAKVVTFKALLDGWAAEKSPASKTLYSWEKVLDQLSGWT